MAREKNRTEWRQSTKVGDAICNGMVGESFPRRWHLSRPEGGEEMSPEDVLGRSFQAEGTARTEAPRQECASLREAGAKQVQRDGVSQVRGPYVSKVIAMVQSLDLL